MSSRLFKHKMAMTSKPPRKPQLSLAMSQTPRALNYVYDSAGSFTLVSAHPGVTVNVHYAIKHSPDGKFTIVAAAGGLRLFRRQNSAYNEITIENKVTTTIPKYVSFSKDGQWIVVVHSTAPYISLYKLQPSGETYAQIPLASGPSLSTAPYDAQFSPDGNYLAFGDGTNFINIYKKVGDTYNTVLARPVDYTAEIHNDVAWSSDSTLLFCTPRGLSTSPNVVVYQRSGDSFSKLASGPASPPGGPGLGIALSPDNLYVAVTSQAGPFITLYRFENNTFTAVVDLPAVLRTIRSADFSDDGKYLALGQDALTGQPIGYIWQRIGDVFMKNKDLYISETTVTLNSISFGPPAM